MLPSSRPRWRRKPHPRPPWPLHERKPPKNWEKIADRIRQRDGNTCRITGFKAKPNQKLPVDHIVPRRFFDGSRNAESPRNLLCVAPGIHAAKTQLESRLLRGDIVGFWQGAVRIGYPAEVLTAAFKNAGLPPLR